LKNPESTHLRSEVVRSQHSSDPELSSAELPASPLLTPGEAHSGGRQHREGGPWRGATMRHVHDIVEQTAGTDIPIVITGGTSAGKGLVAQTVHVLSARRDGPFVSVNCADVSPELLEGELFGQERNLLIGDKIGRFEHAHGGTLFLDEIGVMSSGLQGKLLRFLEDGHVARVGSRSPIAVDVRVLAATSEDLERAVSAGRFRRDLYYRLDVVRIAVPPRFDQPPNNPASSDWRGEHQPRPAHSAKAGEPESGHRVPGAERRQRQDDPLRSKGLDRNAALADTPATPATTSLKEISRKAAQAAERTAIRQALGETRGNRRRAARLLKISYRALSYKLKDASLDQP